MTVQLTPRRSRHRPKFPNALRQYRLRAGLSQGQLASAVGLGRSFVSLCERGLRLPSFPTVVRLARELGTAPQSLYRDLFSSEDSNHAVS